MYFEQITSTQSKPVEPKPPLSLSVLERVSDSMISIPRSLVSKNSTYFGLKVKGLSMKDEGIFDGDIAIIKKTNSAENGKIAAVLTLDNEITLKKVKLTNQKIYLIPANKAYQIKEHSLGDVQIQGTLSGIIRKYN